MDNEPNNETSQILCFPVPKKKEWIWLYTVTPSIFNFILHISSLVIDSTLAFQLAWNDSLLAPAVATTLLIYAPAVFTLCLKPPKLPPAFNCTLLVSWLLETLLQAILFPITITVSLLKQVIWTVTVICYKKPHQEILYQYETFLTQEVHSYLFLQAFLHSCPQAILQIHLILLQVTSSKLTEYFQVISVMVSVITVAKCAALFHRYEAQVMGGRTPVLLLKAPKRKATSNDDAALPIRSCMKDEATALEMDCFIGKVVTFCSWFFIVHSRLLCLVIAKEMYPLTTIITLVFHFSIMLLYQLASQPTKVFDLPYRLLNAICSTIVLVEVSSRFHKITLVYALFYISILAEDTMLTILFFIYSLNICSEGTLSCDNFGMYTYLIINSHVIGIILFGIYLARYQPGSKPVNASLPTSSIS